ERYRVFAQPLRLPVSTGRPDPLGSHGPERYWVVAGLMRTSDFHAASMAISPTKVLAVIALLAFALVILPLLKIGYLGERESFRSFDAVLALGSILAGAALLTFAALFAVAYCERRDRTRQDQEALASQVQYQVTSEIDTLDRTLESFTREAFVDPSRL